MVAKRETHIAPSKRNGCQCMTPLGGGVQMQPPQFGQKEDLQSWVGSPD